LYDDDKILVNYQTSVVPTLHLKTGSITGNTISFETATPSTWGVFENAEMSVLTLYDNKWFMVAGVESSPTFYNLLILL
jgi:hypothetical protein